MRRDISTHVGLLYAIPFVGMLGSAVLIPVLPRIADTLDLPFSQVTWLITTLSIASAVTVPIIGFLSDTYTRTIVLVPGLLLYGLGGLLAGLSPLLTETPFTLLIMSRVLQGVGSAGTTVQALALAGDLLEPKRRARVMGTLETFNAIGKAAGPLIGAGLATFGWFVPFFIFPATAIPVAIIIWHRLGRLPKPEKQRDPFADHIRAFWQTVRPKFIPLAVTFVVAFVGVSVNLLLLTLLSRELADAGIKGIVRGAYITVPEIVVAGAALAAAKYLRIRLEHRGRRLALVGLGILAVGLVGSALHVSVAVFIAVVNVAAVGSGAVLATMNSLVANSVPTAGRGFATSLYGTFRSLSALTLPMFFKVRDVLGTEQAVFWLLGGLTALLAVAAYFLLNTKRLLTIDESAHD